MQEKFLKEQAKKEEEVRKEQAKKSKEREESSYWTFLDIKVKLDDKMHFKIPVLIGPRRIFIQSLDICL